MTVVAPNEIQGLFEYKRYETIDDNPSFSVFLDGRPIGSARLYNLEKGTWIAHSIDWNKHGKDGCLEVDGKDEFRSRDDAAKALLAHG
jgi:hypothetical protein